jgi:transposase
VRLQLAADRVAELRALINSREVPATIATRARIVLWRAEGRRRNETAALARVSLPTVDRWLQRYAEAGVSELADESRAAPRAQVRGRDR